MSKQIKIWSNGKETSKTFGLDPELSFLGDYMPDAFVEDGIFSACSCSDVLDRSTEKVKNATPCIVLTLWFDGRLHITYNTGNGIEAFEWTKKRTDPSSLAITKKALEDFVENYGNDALVEIINVNRFFTGTCYKGVRDESALYKNSNVSARSKAAWLR